MSKTKQLPKTDDDEINFIVDDINKELKESSNKKTKTIKKELPKNMDKEKCKKTIQAHRVEIAKIKAKRAGLKAEIKKHKLLIKQAKLVYKLTKMKG